MGPVADRPLPASWSHRLTRFVIRKRYGWGIESGTQYIYGSGNGTSTRFSSSFRASLFSCSHCLLER